jgi:hypothetical protein
MRLPRFQFRLRTLMIVVTLLAMICGYVRWHSAVVAKRRREAVAKYKSWVALPLPASLPGNAHSLFSPRPMAPWPLRWFGEEGYALIVVPMYTSDDEIERLRKLFPEAEVLPEVSPNS